MISISTAAPDSFSYHEISKFAQAVYKEQLGADIEPKPDLFASARLNGKLVGCFGLYRAYERPLTIERYLPEVFPKLASCSLTSKDACAELGTRVVVKIPGLASFHVSVALVATLVTHAYDIGIRYVAFTSNRRSHLITDKLGFPLIDFGNPSIEGMDDAFKKNWEKFFSIEQRCYGFVIDSIEGCGRALLELEPRGITPERIPLAA